MASVTFTYPDDAGTLIATAFAQQFGYQPTLRDGTPNPQTTAEFAQQKLVEYVRSVCRNYVVQQAEQTARIQARAIATEQVDAVPVTVTMQ